MPSLGKGGRLTLALPFSSLLPGRGFVLHDILFFSFPPFSASFFCVL